MSIGARLDRPSALGDEGRARAVSLWIASLVVLALVALGGRAIGQGGLLTSLGTVVGGTVAGLGLLNRERFGALVAGHFLFYLFGTVLVVWVGAALLSDFGLAIAGLALAMVGVGAGWANLGSRDAFEHVFVGTVVTYVTVLVATGLLVTTVVVLLAGRWLVEVTTTGVSPGVALTWFLLAVGYAAAGLRVLLWRLPVEQLTARRKRERRMARLTLVGRFLLATTLATPVAILGVWVAVALGAFAWLGAVAPPLALAIDALAWPPVLGAVAAVGTLALGGAVVVFAARAGTRRLDAAAARVLGGVVAGVVLTGLMVTVVLAAALAPAYSTLTTALVILVGFNVGPIVLVATVPVGIPAVALGLLPDRAGGPAVAALGLAVAAVGFGAAPAWVPLACAAGCVVAWDVSAYGLGLTAELGHLPATRRLELVHGVLVVGVGLVAVGLATGLAALRSALALPGSSVAALVAGVGALLLLVPLRG